MLAGNGSVGLRVKFVIVIGQMDWVNYNQGGAIAAKKAGYPISKV